MTAEACKPLLSRPSHLIGYHMIIEGELVVSVADLPPVSLHAGDIVIMPRNDMQTLGSAPGLTPVDGRSFVEPSPD
ncbi:cupin domain-containing protein, partial [Vibrio parahaemolyticus]